MNNKLKEILDEFHSIYGHKIQEDLHKEYRETLAEKFVEYARSKIPDKKTMPPEDSYDLGYNDAVFDMIASISKDEQSINN